MVVWAESTNVFQLFYLYSILIVRSEKRFDRGCSGQSDVGETLLSVERRRGGGGEGGGGMLLLLFLRDERLQAGLTGPDWTWLSPAE